MTLEFYFSLIKRYDQLCGVLFEVSSMLPTYWNESFCVFATVIFSIFIYGIIKGNLTGKSFV